MSTKSQVNNTFQRRPSFWKTPITRTSPSLTGVKRNYSQINSEQNNHNHEPNQHKKRRLLNKSEIADIAKFGGLQASNIILAVRESDGFCWFKRKTSINTTFNKQKHLQKYWNVEHSSGVLRELSKEELTKRQTDKTTKPKPTKMNEINPNLRNKQALQNAAQTRRHTLPVDVLSNIEAKKKKKKKKRRKKKKRVVKYKTTQEVIRKKVKKMKRIVYKKKTRSTTIRITTSYARVAIPDFPVPCVGLSVLFVSEEGKAYDAIKKFELSLMESFVMPLTHVYSHQLSFITRNVLQLLMELTRGIDAVVQSMEHEVVAIPIKRSIVWYKEMAEKKHESISPPMETHISPVAKTSQMAQLEEEYTFYEAQWKALTVFVEGLDEEIEFTQCVQREMMNEDYLRNMFDFDVKGVECESVVNDDGFVANIAADIDAIYSEYCMDLVEIESAQRQYEWELKQRELAYLELMTNKEDMEQMLEKEKEMNGTLKSVGVVDAHKDKMILMNLIKTNKRNDHNEDMNGHSKLSYLRQLNGYQMRC
eukprot:504265_1